MHRILFGFLFLLVGSLVTLLWDTVPVLRFVTQSSRFFHSPPPLAQQIDPEKCPLGYQVQGTEFCTHGPDPAPAGFAIDRPVQPLPNTHLEPAPVICDGDGVSGKRIQVLYVRTTDAADRYDQYLPSIRTWLAEIDAVVVASAQATGGIRHLRFVTNAACQPEVVAVALPPDSEKTFGDLVNALDKLGYNRADRKYLLFVDAKVYCGAGTIRYDSQPGPENLNNIQTGYARIDSGCWGLKPLLHELIHTLGGVQYDSPHSTRGWHCTDEYDMMCYADSPNHPPITYPCSDKSHESRLDCNHDDYFHTAPPPDSYLATHWNVAQSGFLIAGDGPSPPPEVILVAPTPAITFTTPTTITLTAHAVDRDGSVQRVEFYYDGALLATIITPTYTYTWTQAPTGIHTLYAKAYDDVGASQTSAPVIITVTDADGLINSARGKLATQASTAGAQVADRAVDGITTETENLPSTAQTLVQSQPWWQVDLGTALPIEKLHIWGSARCCPAAQIGLEVLVSATPILTQSLASAALQPGVTHYHLAGQGSDPLTLVMPPGQNARYVLIGALATTALALTEVEVMIRPENAPVGGQNGPGASDTGKIYLPVISLTGDPTRR